MADLLKDEEFCRWVKSVMALEMTRSPLIEFVEEVVINRHKKIIDKVRAAGSPCFKCDLTDKAICQSCEIMKQEITKDHRSGRPTFRNTSIRDCETNPWELAKCYMASGNEKVRSPSETDTSGFLLLIINNMIFQYHTSENLNDMNNIFQQVREVRNSIMHSPENRTTKRAFDNQLKTIVDMLESVWIKGKIMKAKKESRKTMGYIRKLKTDNVSLDDIQRANSEAVKFFKSYEADIRERIKECENRMVEIKATISKGMEQIEESKERGVDTIDKKTVMSEKVIQDATNLGTKTIHDKTEAGVQKIEDKTNQSTRIIEEQRDAVDKDFREKGKQLSEGISKIKDVRKDALEALDKDTKATVELIDKKTNKDIDEIQNVTKLCMEILRDQSKASGETMQDMQEQLGDVFKVHVEEMVETGKNQIMEQIDIYDIEMDSKLEEMRELEKNLCDKIKTSGETIKDKLGDELKERMEKTFESGIEKYESQTTEKKDDIQKVSQQCIQQLCDQTEKSIRTIKDLQDKISSEITQANKGVDEKTAAFQKKVDETFLIPEEIAPKPGDHVLEEEDTERQRQTQRDRDIHRGTGREGDRERQRDRDPVCPICSRRDCDYPMTLLRESIRTCTDQ